MNFLPPDYYFGKIRYNRLHPSYLDLNIKVSIRVGFNFKIRFRIRVRVKVRVEMVFGVRVGFTIIAVEECGRNYLLYLKLGLQSVLELVGIVIILGCYFLYHNQGKVTCFFLMKCFCICVLLQSYVGILSFA